MKYLVTGGAGFAGLNFLSSTNRKRLEFFGWAIGFSLAAYLFSLCGLKWTVGILAVIFFVALGFLDYSKFLLLAVFIRSSLDAFTNTALSIGPLNLNPAGFLGLALAFFTPFHCFRKSGTFDFPVAMGLLLFLVLSVPSICSAFLHFGAEGAVALKEFIRLGSLLSLLVSLLAFFKTPAETKKLFYASFSSLVIPLSAGFYQALTGTGDTVSTAGQNRVFGTLFHPNVFGLYLSVFIAVTLSWHKSVPSGGKKLLLAGLLTAQFLTFSLGALAATGLIFALHLWQDKSLRKSRVIFLIGLLVTLFFLSENWKVRFQRVTQMRLTTEVQTGEISNSFSWRVLHWYVLFQYAKEHPIVGWGLLTTEKVTPWKTEEGQGHAAHNDIVRLFLETGLVGLSGYFVFLFYTGRWIFKKQRKQNPGREAGLSAALKAVFLTLLMLSAGAEEPLVHTAFVYYFLTFLVLAKNGFDWGHLKPARELADKN